MTRTMGDSTNMSAIPLTVNIAAVYIDGHLGVETEAQLAARFPHDKYGHVFIDVTGAMPAAEYFFSRQTVLFTLGIFVLFRLFDIAKPWPVRGSQSLPGGWGVTVDDLLAAVYVNLVVLLVFLVKHWF